jgi:phosphoglycerate dehydrogenase-like enzyme
VTAVEVLVTEPIMGRFADALTRDGASPHAWTFAYGEDPRLLEAAATAEVLVCSSATPELLAAMPRLRLVHVTGAGYDRIPLDALPHGTLLCNTFHHGRSIAEHVLMVAMMLRRGVLRAERDIRAGTWRNVIVDQTYPFGGVLSGRTLGVVGFGEIGSAVARLGSAMGMDVRAVRRNPAGPVPPDLDLAWVGGDHQLPELLAASDVVVVTVPLSDTTRGLIDTAALARMRPTAVLINVSRGAVVDEQALHRALVDGTIAGAGIDVWWRNARDPEAPLPSHLDFTGLDNVVLTPHQSGHTEEVFAGRARDISDNVDALAEGRGLRNEVAL